MNIHFMRYATSHKPKIVVHKGFWDGYLLKWRTQRNFFLAYGSCQRRNSVFLKLEVLLSCYVFRASLFLLFCLISTEINRYLASCYRLCLIPNRRMVSKILQTTYKIFRVFLF